MIKNEKQLAVTVKLRDKFEDAINEIFERDSSDPLQEAYLASLRYDLNKLDQQIEEYNRAVMGKFVPVTIANFDTVGSELVSARIAANLTQESLAELVDCKAQQIQRYEQSEYASASLAKLQKIAGVLLAALPHPLGPARRRRRGGQR